MDDQPYTEMLRIAELPAGEPHGFRVEPDAAARAAIAEALDLSALRKARLEGRLVPEGRRDWRLEATLGATVVQPCVVTLEPVTTRIDVAVTRRFLAEPPPVPEADEVEMPEDETLEPLPAVPESAGVPSDGQLLELVSEMPLQGPPIP